jgi:hypothetical protein
MSCMDSIKGAIELCQRFENTAAAPERGVAPPAADALPIFHWIAAGQAREIASAVQTEDQFD